jgi:hypothetical protein
VRRRRFRSVGSGLMPILMGSALAGCGIDFTEPPAGQPTRFLAAVTILDTAVDGSIRFTGSFEPGRDEGGAIRPLVSDTVVVFGRGIGPTGTDFHGTLQFSDEWLLAPQHEWAAAELRVPNVAGSEASMTVEFGVCRRGGPRELTVTSTETLSFPLSCERPTDQAWPDLVSWHLHIRAGEAGPVAGEGAHATVADAVAASKPLDVIHIRPGVYTEAVRVTHPLTIVAAGERGETEIGNDEASPLEIACDVGTVRLVGLTLRGDGRSFGIVVYVLTWILAPLEADEVLARLDALAETLGVAVDFLFTVLVRQAYIEAMTIIVFGTLVVALDIVYVRWIFKNFERIDKDSDAGLEIVVAIISGLVLTFASLGVVINVFRVPTLLLNPEYWALNQILSVLN